MIQLRRLSEFLAGEAAIKKGLVLFLGPLFLIISLFLTGFSAHPSIIWTAAIIGLVLIWKLPRIGLISSLLFLLAVSLFSHLKTHHHLWQAGLEITIAIGLVITHFSFSLFHHLVESLERRGEENEKELLALQEKNKLDLDLFQKEKDSFVSQQTQFEKDQIELEQKLSMAFAFTDTLQTTLEASKQIDLEYHDLTCSYALLKEEKEALKDAELLKKNNLELLQKLNQIRVEKFQVHLINEALARFLSKESVKNKEAIDQAKLKEEELHKVQEDLKGYQKELLLAESKLNELTSHNSLLQEELSKEKQISHTQYLSETNSLKKEVQALLEKIEEKNLLLQSNDKGLVEARKAEHSYLELRKQFEEKSQLLHQTRGELFIMETQVLALRKEQEEALLESSDQSLIATLVQLQKENEQLDEEVQELRKVITGLLIQEKPKASRKKTASKDQLPLV